MFAFDNNNNNPNAIINYYNTIINSGQLTELVSGISNDFYNFYNLQTQINQNITNEIHSTWTKLHNLINITYNNLSYSTYLLSTSINNIENWQLIAESQILSFKNIYNTNIENIYYGLESIFNTGTYDRYIGFTYSYTTTEHGEKITIYTDTSTFTYFDGFNTSKYPFQDSGTKTGLAWKTDIPTFPDTNEFLLSTAYDDILNRLSTVTSALNSSMWSLYSNITNNTRNINSSVSNINSSINLINNSIVNINSTINLINNSIVNISSNLIKSITNYYNSATTKINNTYSSITNIINSFSTKVNSSFNNVSSSINNIFESINSIKFKLQNNTLTPLITQLMSCPAITTAPVTFKTITDTKQELVYNIAGGHFWGVPTGGVDALLPGWEDVYQWLFGNFEFEKDVVYNGSMDYISNWKDSYWWEVVNSINACNERMTLSPFAMRYHTFMTATLASLTFINGAPYTAKYLAQKTRRIEDYVSHHYGYNNYPPNSARVGTHTCWVCDKKLLVSAPFTITHNHTYTSFIEYRPYLLNNNFITSLYVINPYNSPDPNTNNFYADMTIDKTKLKQLDVLYDNNFILGWADNWESVCCSGESVYVPIHNLNNLETFRLHVMNDEEFDYRGLHDTFNLILKQNTNLKFFEFKMGPTYQTMTMSYRLLNTEMTRVKLNQMFPNLETLIFYPNLFYSGMPNGFIDTLRIQYEDIFNYIKDFSKLKHIELGVFDDWFRLPTKSILSNQVKITCSPSYVKIDGYIPHYENFKLPSFENTNNENVTVDLSGLKWRYYYNQLTLIYSQTISNRPPEPERLEQVIPLFKTGTIHILLNSNMYKYLKTKIDNIINNWTITDARSRYKIYNN